jgi:hypothetical protein
MAYSTRFGANIITAARRLHDNRTYAESNSGTYDVGMRYSSDILRQYQNMAIKDIIRDLYQKFLDKVDHVIPEMISESADITLTAGLGDLPTGTWIVLEAAKSDYSLYYTKIDANPLKVRASRDPLLTPSASKPVFYQIGLKIQVLPTSVTGPAHTWSLMVPADTALDSAGEVQLATVWDGEIVRRMVDYGLQDAKSAVAI